MLLTSFGFLEEWVEGTHLLERKNVKIIIAGALFNMSLDLNGKLVMKGKMVGAKYSQIIEENLFESTRDPHLGQSFMIQQNSDP